VVDLFCELSTYCLQPDTFSVNDNAAKIQRPVTNSQLHQAPLTPLERSANARSVSFESLGQSRFTQVSNDSFYHCFVSKYLLLTEPSQREALILREDLRSYPFGFRGPTGANK
jgi:hypothetical protein